jgi:hypothetical protein
MESILIVDDDCDLLRALREGLFGTFRVETASDPREALEYLRTVPELAVVMADMRMPGMLHGRVVRPPYAGADHGEFIGNTLAYVERNSIAHIDGIRAVVVQGDFVGIVAEREEQAEQAMHELVVKWKSWPGMPDVSNAAEAIRLNPRTTRELVNEGDVLFKLDVLTAKSNHEAARRDLAGFQENLISQQALLRGIEQTDANRRKQLALIERELEGVKDLVREGYAPLVKQLQLESSKLDHQTAINDLHTNRQRTRQAILELEHQIAAAQQKVVAVAQDLALLEIRAPASGQVVGLQVQSVGGVIQPAQKLLDIVCSMRK